MSGRQKSRTQVWRDAIRDSQLDKTAKLVAFVLSTYMRAEGSAFPGVETLARGASLSDRAVQGALRRLEREGWLHVEWSRGGPQKTHRFLARLPATVNEVRRSEWSIGAPPSGFNPEANDPNPERGDSNPERASGESAESAEDGERVRAERSTLAHLYVQSCLDCSSEFATDDPDAVSCRGCIGKEAAA